MDDGIDNDKPKNKEEITSNSLGLALILISVGIFFTPAFFPSVAPNGWEVVTWITWAMVFFVVGILALMFPSKKPPSSKDSQSESE
jgi:O-antigen/teichoic acid export membrane protein